MQAKKQSLKKDLVMKYVVSIILMLVSGSAYTTQLVLPLNNNSEYTQAVPELDEDSALDNEQEWLDIFELTTESWIEIWLNKIRTGIKHKSTIIKQIVTKKIDQLKKWIQKIAQKQ